MPPEPSTEVEVEDNDGVVARSVNKSSQKKENSKTVPPQKAPPSSPRVIYKQQTEIDFESLDITGELKKPSGTLSLGDNRARYSPTDDEHEPRISNNRTFVDESTSKNEEFTDYGINPFVETAKDKLSTFSIDVDTASYTIGRRKLNEGTLPPYASVRVEEYVNYFDYDYPSPTKDPFSVHVEAMPDPFRSDRHILRVGLQGKEIAPTDRPSLRLTFLVDVSGSMSGHDKLPMAKSAMHLLVDTLREDDSISLVTYASGSTVILRPTYGDRKEDIHQAIEKLQASGSTAMSSGMEMAGVPHSRTQEESAVEARRAQPFQNQIQRSISR